VALAAASASSHCDLSLFLIISLLQVHLSEENLSTLLFDIAGPVDTPFEGGVFRVRLQLGGDYPSSAPKGWFLTKIFHPNMNVKTGEICVSTLKKDWKPAMGLRHVCISIRCLLIEPNPESALNEDAAKLMLDNYADYYARAKIMTKIHAKPAVSAAAAETDDSAAAAATAAVDGAAAGDSSPAAPGEEENKDAASAGAAAAAVGATGAATAAAAKKPLNLSSATNAAPAPAAAAPVAKLSASAAAASAAEAKAKAAKKKSLKRL
jgi:ubiquitin-conjugating enzyme E2 S